MPPLSFIQYTLNGSGSSWFCFPESPTFPRDEVEGNMET